MISEDFTFDNVAKTITWQGSTTTHTVLELHRWLQSQWVNTYTWILMGGEWVEVPQ
jgi:hypothetical protein